MTNSASESRPVGLRTPALLFLVLGGLAVAWGGGWLLPPAPENDLRHHLTARWLGGGALVIALLLLAAPRALRAKLAGAMADLTARIDALAGRTRALDLVAISVCGLFLEVLLIRWHASELRAAAYFKNVTLLAAFLGLGLGFAATDRARLSLLWTPCWLALQVVILAVLGARGADDALRMPSGQEWIWGVPLAEWDWSSPDNPQTRYWLQAGAFYGFYAALFVSTILIFIPLGQLTGRLMRNVAPIRAYTLNILGSLAGVVLFAAVSYLWWPPVAWFALAGALLVWAARHEALHAATTAGCLFLLLAVVGAHDGANFQQNVYSPYQRLEVEREALADHTGRLLDTGVLISANRAYHLRTVNLAPEFVGANADRFPRLAQMQAAYDLPYRFQPRPRRVLIVGAGGGNDVAAALRNGAEHVDAVEIDPAIVALGRRYHAERPYDDPRVTVHVNDARAFMRARQESNPPGTASGATNQAPDRYDLIVFGLLDSHTLLSGMTAVRLDNFVYTRESFEAAGALLKPDGVLALSFATGAAGFLPTRLHDLLQSVFSAAPQCFELGYDDGMSFIVARGRAASAPAPVTTAPRALGVSAASSVRPTQIQLQPDVAPATDDWPFLYLQGRRWRDVPMVYPALIGLLAAISVVWILAGSGRRTGVSPHFFFLGAAFLLIEVKGITELALIFGTTWVVNSIVIAALLLLILLANLFVTVWPKQHRAVHYGLLGASLLAGYFVPGSALLGFGWSVAAVAAPLLLLVPLFFAGVIFAISLREAPSLPRAFSSNLLGAILGGLCEYSAMTLGFRSLYLLGLALYALSFLTLRRSGRTPGPETAAGGAPAVAGEPLMSSPGAT